DDLKDRIANTVEYLKLSEVGAFDGAEDRDCSITLPNQRMIDMNCALSSCAPRALPHFYFHVVSAYDILRHKRVVIGKQNCLSQPGGFIRSRKEAHLCERQNLATNSGDAFQSVRRDRSRTK